MTRWRGWPRAPEGWAWARWELVHVEACGDGLIVDALEIAVDESDLPAHPVTLCLGTTSAASRRRAVTACSQLARWMEHGDGVCDVLHQRAAPYDYLALFQGEESLVLTGEDDEIGR